MPRTSSNENGQKHAQKCKISALLWSTCFLSQTLSLHKRFNNNSKPAIINNSKQFNIITAQLQQKPLRNKLH